jgi:hypothetical protein
MLVPAEGGIDAMFGHISDDLTTELRIDAAQLDDACQRYFGVSGAMFRTAKFVFYIATLLFSAYLIEVASVTPILAMGFAALLITGPEGLEAYLIRQGVIDNRE